MGIPTKEQAHFMIDEANKMNPGPCNIYTLLHNIVDNTFEWD